MADKDLALARALIREQTRREAFPKAVEQVVAGLFPAQRKLVESSSKRIANHAGRRGGKTTGEGARILRAASRHPGQVIPVFERTLTCKAADTFWTALLEFDAQYKLGFKFHHTLKVATCPNRATIQLMGADTIEACDKARGGKYPEVFIDEAPTFRPKVLEYLLYEVVKPATMDFDGVIGMGGTPGPVLDGPFYKACVGEDKQPWEVHHWTMLDNPFVPNTAKGAKPLSHTASRLWREQWLAENIGWSPTHGWANVGAKDRREYGGLWVPGDDALMYPYSAARNLCTDPPHFDDTWTYILGIDVGHNDPCAFVVLATKHGAKHVYVVESYAQEGLIPSAMAAHVERLRARYSFRTMVIDTGGLGKGYAEEAKQRFGLPLVAARKRNKVAHVEYLAGDLRNGTLQFVQRGNQELCADLAMLPWNADHTDADPKYADHLPDALLYAHGALRELSRGLGERDAPEPGSAEWYAAEDAKIDQALAEDYVREHPEPEDDESLGILGVWQ